MVQLLGTIFSGRLIHISINGLQRVKINYIIFVPVTQYTMQLINVLSFLDNRGALWHRTIHNTAPSIPVTPSLPPFIPSNLSLSPSPCWLGPSAAPAWIAARPQSSCHCCAACAGRLPAWWDAARPEIRLGPLPCMLPGQLTGWAGEECGFQQAPGKELRGRGMIGAVDVREDSFIIS